MLSNEHSEMRQIAVAFLALVAASTLTLLQFTSDAFGDSSVPNASVASAKVESITGRITSVDTKAGMFVVRAIDGEIVHLHGSNQVAPNRLRRGERVVVTYANGVALTVQATRSEKSP
jgi:hypothetical protein